MFPVHYGLLLCLFALFADNKDPYVSMLDPVPPPLEFPDVKNSGLPVSKGVVLCTKGWEEDEAGLKESRTPSPRSDSLKASILIW